MKKKKYIIMNITMNGQQHRAIDGEYFTLYSYKVIKKL